MNPPNSSSAQTGFHLSLFTPTRLANLALANLKTVSAITGLMVVLAVLYGLLAEPVFEANALIQIEGVTSSDVQSLLSLSGLNLPDSRPNTSAEIELIRSRRVVGEVVSRLGLQIEAQPVRVPVLGAAWARWGGALKDKPEPSYRLLWGYAWGDEHIRVRQLEVPPDLIETRLRLTALGEGRYSFQLPHEPQVHQGVVGKPSVISTPTGRVVLEVGELMGLPGTQYVVKQWSVLETTEDLQKALTLSEVGRQSGVMGVALEGNDPRTTARILTEVVNSYLQQNSDRRSEASERLLQFGDRRLPQILTELEQAEQNLSEFKSKHGAIDFAESGKTLLTQMVAAWVKLNELQQRKIEVAGTLAPQHPQMRVIDDLIKDAQKTVNELEGQLKGLPKLEPQALTLSRNVKVLSELYALVLGNSQQMRMVKESKVGKVWLIDAPRVPEEPVKPKHLVVLPISLLVGLLLSLFYLMMRIIIRNNVQSAEEIEQVLGLTVCAYLPHNRTQSKLNRAPAARGSGLLAKADPMCPTIEGIRSLLTPLQMLKTSGKPSWIMVTGPTPEVGKSFVSANLASMVAAAGHGRVLLVDADLRLGSQHKIFGLASGAGLSTALEQSRPCIDFVQRNVIDGLDVLPAGPALKNSGDLLRNPRAQQLFSELQDHYDYIVVDTPPVLLLADAESMVSRMDTVLMVVRDMQTTLMEIERATKRLLQSGSPRVEVVFNDVHAQMRLGSAYGGVSQYTRYERYGQTAKLDTGA
ncbi:MAG: polysaccharide biosynthesis tyrosine autokinase [Alphaproteobacteria bacterium]|nr:polysaccharide biosynthesis tyrosine autokinase [Alphaproteobacteria bacterium]